MEMGFTAYGNTFYKTNELQRCSFTWLHDERILRLKTFFVDGKNDTLTSIFKYDSFQRFNMTVKHNSRGGGDDSSIIEVDIIFVVRFTPVFTFRIWDDRTHKFEVGRFFKQHYRDIVNEYWDDLINATAFRITYKIKRTEFDSWKRKLISRLQCTVTYNEMFHEEYSVPVNSFMIDANLPDDAKYNVDCICRLGTVGYFFLDYCLSQYAEMLNELERNQQWYLISQYFASVFTFLKKDISLASLNFYFNPDNLNVKQNFGTQYVPIKTAYVTPTKILFEIEEDTSDCRGFRKLGHEKILQVKFVDEDGSWFPRDQNLLIDRMLPILRNKISVGGKDYFDFGSSSSLFQQNGTYFCEAKSHEEIIKTIDNEFGEFKTEQAAKVAARLGQYFSSAREIKRKLKNDEIGILEEIVSTPENPDEPKYTFSDGIGIIDISFAEQIQRELDIPYTPTAFQFRCIGYKGMVAVDPDNEYLVSNGGPFLVMFRDSQNKFTAVFLETPDNRDPDIDFEVVKYSGPAPLKLHNDFIALLTALARKQGKLKVVENRLRELFNESIIENLQSMYDPKAFTKALRKMPKHFPLNLFRPHELLQQDFFRSIIEVNAVNYCKLLTSKCQIPIPQSLGRRALGVIDETGLLKEGEIYFQYFNDIRPTASYSPTTVHTGPVGVTKSPMYHIGDIRFLTAVDYPELRHYVDVVVFSRQGKRPVPDQIGGGDLDGDIYDIFWDPAFLMEHSEPADFNSPVNQDVKLVTIEELHQSHASFRVDFVLKNNLNEISNYFRSHITLHHPDHPEVKALSKKADVAVNTFKSGIFGDPISEHEKPIFLPNFMNQRQKPSFDSDHILSKLHKLITRIYLMMQVSQNDAQERRRMKAGRRNIQASRYAQDMFNDYCYELNKLMNKFGIKTEAELFANIILDPLGSFSKSIKRYEDTTINVIQEELSKIIGKFRRMILDEFKYNWERDMYERGESLSTYYIRHFEIPDEMIFLAKEFQHLSENNGKFLSFQYLMVEALDSSIFSEVVDYSVCNTIDELIADFIEISCADSSFDEDELKKAIEIEEQLIRLSFSPRISTFEQQRLHERIIPYPPFVVSIPQAYSNVFKNYSEVLKKISGCRDVVIRFKSNEMEFNHYVISCEGTIESCIQLEKILTSYLEFDESMKTSFEEMQHRKIHEMQINLNIIKSYRSTPLPVQNEISSPSPIRRNTERSLSRRYHPYSRPENSNRRRHSV